jgi:signal transduction histidine kinase
MYMLVQLLERRLTKLGVNMDGRLGGYIHKLRHEMQGFNRLVQEFRAFSEPPQLVFRLTNLATLLGEMLTAETPRYLAQGIGVERAFAPHVPQARVDADALKQVFSQLCQNAVEAMPEGGTLSVRLYNSDTQIRLEVADTGIGLPAGVPIFAPWVTTKAQGTGLGLTLVQHLVAAHAGQIRYLSTPGQGTTFTLILPLTPPGQTGNRTVRLH